MNLDEAVAELRQAGAEINHDIETVAELDMIYFLTDKRLDEDRLNELYAVALRHGCRMVVYGRDYKSMCIETGLWAPWSDQVAADRFDEWKRHAYRPS